MSDPRQRIVIKVFRKYSHSIGPDALAFLEDVLNQYHIADEELEYSVDLIAKTYNKQDDATMKVSLAVLRKAYEVLQGTNDQNAEVEDILDADSHLYFINAHDMPCWNWTVERSTFERSSQTPSNSGSAESRVIASRNRLNIIRQVILRNEHFSPSTIPSKDRDRLLTLRSTKQLLGRAGTRFLLFGMLVHSKEGKLCLEDQDGMVELDFSELDQPSEGLFTEGCFALIEGDYTEDETLVVIAIGHPPCERRDVARSIYGHIDFLGQGATTLLEDAKYAQRMKTELSELCFFVLSDVWLDHPETLRGLRKLFDNCIENSYIPHVFVLCGNFSSRGVAQGNGRDITRYQESFSALGELIGSYPIIVRHSHFVFVPGPLDIAANSILPRRPLLSSLVAQLKSKVPKAHFGTNPCRINFFGQEIVIFREDMMARMLRNLVGVKPDVKHDDLKRYLVQTILDQSHLVPLSASIQPIASEYDHALRLYPLPTALVLADKYERYEFTYESCHVFNPGSFIGNSFGFSTYIPALGRSEASVLGFEE